MCCVVLRRRPDCGGVFGVFAWPHCVAVVSNRRFLQVTSIHRGVDILKGLVKHSVTQNPMPEDDWEWENVCQHTGTVFYFGLEPRNAKASSDTRTRNGYCVSIVRSAVSLFLNHGNFGIECCNEYKIFTCS